MNNSFNDRINKELPRSFSICDIDGCIRKEYGPNTRLIIYEHKEKETNNKLSDTQYTTLLKIHYSVDWSLYDNNSGVYIFIVDGNNIEVVDIVSGETLSVLDFRTTFLDWINAVLDIKRDE